MLVTDIQVMETWSGPVPFAAIALAAALVAHTAASARRDRLSSTTRAPFVLFECAHYKSECRACVRGEPPLPLPDFNGPVDEIGWTWPNSSRRERGTGGVRLA